MKDIPSFNLQYRLAGDSVRSLFQIAIFKLFVKTVKDEKGAYLRKNLDNLHILSREYYKQSLPPEFSHITRGSRLMSMCYGPRTKQN